MTDVDEIEQRNAALVRSYKLAFGSPAGQEVLVDLVPFCRANTTAFHADPRIHASLEGRREVWLRIQNFMNLTPQQISALSRGDHVKIATGDDDGG